MTPLQYCRTSAAAEGSDCYYALLGVAPPLEAGLLALFALEQELLQAVEDCSDAGVARTKLQFWQQQIAALPDGATHPVAVALVRSAAVPEPRARTLAPLLANAVARISADQVRDETQLHLLCRDGAGHIMALAARLCGACAAAQECARETGAAVEQVRLLRLPRRAGAPPHTSVPLSLMARHGARPVEVDTGSDAQPAQALRAALLEAADRRLEAAAGMEPGAPLVVRRLGRLARARIQALRQAGYVRDASAGSVAPLRKLWIAWRTPA